MASKKKKKTVFDVLERKNNEESIAIFGKDIAERKQISKKADKISGIKSFENPSYTFGNNNNNNENYVAQKILAPSSYNQNSEYRTSLESLFNNFKQQNEENLKKQQQEAEERKVKELESKPKKESVFKQTSDDDEEFVDKKIVEVAKEYQGLSEQELLKEKEKIVKQQRKMRKKGDYKTPNRKWWNKDDNLLRNIGNVLYKSLLEKDPYNLSDEYNELTARELAIQTALDNARVKNHKYDKGLVGLSDKFSTVLTSGLEEASQGMEATVNKIIGNKPTKSDLEAIRALGGNKTYLQKLSDKTISETDNKILKSGLEIAHSTGQMLPQMMMPGGKIATVVGFANYGGSAYNNAINDGYTEEQATKYGVVNGTLEMALNKVLPSFKLNGKNIYGKTASDKLTSKIMSKVLNNSAIKSAILDASGEFTEEYLQEFLDPIVREALLEEDNNVGIKGYNGTEVAKNIAKYTAQNFFSKENLHAGILGFASSGMLGTVNTHNAYKYEKATGRNAETNLTQNEQAVIDSIVENRTEELKKQQEKVTKKDISKIEQEVRQDLERGYIETNDIERALSNEEWNKHNEVVKRADDIKNKITELENTDFKTVGEFNSVNEKINSLKSEFNNIDINTTREELNNVMMNKINDNDTLLQRAYGEEIEKGNKYQFDKNEKLTEQTKKINEDIEKLGLNNNIKTRDTVDLIKKLSNETGRQYRLIDNNSTEMEKVEGKNVDGFVKNGEVFINVDSENLINRILGHETTHLFEGTEDYTKLQNIAKEYAKTKGEYDSRKSSLEEVYKDIKDANIENELTSDLVGDYLFSDIEFVRNLSTEQPTMFQKIYNHVKHLYNMATAGSKEARQLEQLKYNFEKVYRENNQSKTSNNTKYSMIGIKGAENLAKNSDTRELKKLSKNQKIAEDIHNNSSKTLDETNIESKANTGWFKTKYGDWGTLISDKDAKIIKKLEPNKVYRLGDIFEHEELYKAYPKLKNLKVITQEFDGNRKLSFGAYSPKLLSKGIYLNNFWVENQANYKGTLLHEINHYIEAYEKYNKNSKGATFKETDRNNNLGEIISHESKIYSDFTQQELNDIILPELAKSNPQFKNISEQLKNVNEKDFYSKLNRIINKGIYDYENNEYTRENKSKIENEEVQKTNEKGQTDSLIFDAEELDNSSFSLKQKQLDIIQKNNPVNDDYHTWIRNIDDIKTLEETLQDEDWGDYDEINPDLSKQDILDAIEKGKITVYSSYPIEQGVFVSPSQMEAESYSGDGKVYSKEVNINDVAWIDPTQGQYAKVDNNTTMYSLSVKEAKTETDNNGVKLSKEQQEYFKDSKATDDNGNLITVYHTTTDAVPQFNEFNPVGTQYYRFGDQVVNYYTDSKDMSGSYASQDYAMADTTKINNKKELDNYLKKVSDTTGNMYNVEQRDDGKYIVSQDKQISKEARDFISKLSDSEKQQMLDNIYEDEHEEIKGTNYERVFSWNYFDKELQKKYHKVTEKYLGTADTVAIQQEMMKYLESPVLLHEDSRLNGEVVNLYDTESDMFKNIKTDMQKSDWSKNSKIQYEGYVNITNPYIIDAEERNWNQVVQQSNDFIDELEERVPQDVKDNLTRLYQESANKSAEARENYDVLEQVIRQGIDGYQSAVDEEIQKANQVVKKVGFNEIEQILNDTQNIGVNPWYNIAEALQDEGVIGSATKTFIIDEFKLPKQVKEWLQENYNKGIPLHQIPTNNPLKLMEQLDKNTTPSLKDIYNKNAQNYEEFDKYRMPNSYFMEQISSEGNDYLGNELNDIFETRAEIYSPEQVGEEIAQASSVAFSKPEMIRLWGTSKTTNDVVKEIIASNKDGTTNYDGVIIKNVYDYGGHSATGTQANDLYITFNSNQFKAADNKTPTNDSDIRYRLSDKNDIAPIKKNPNEVFGKEMRVQQDKAVKKAIAPLQKEVKALKQEISDLKENNTNEYVGMFADGTNEQLERAKRNLTTSINRLTRAVEAQKHMGKDWASQLKINSDSLEAVKLQYKELQKEYVKRGMELEDVVLDEETQKVLDDWKNIDEQKKSNDNDVDETIRLLEQQPQKKEKPKKSYRNDPGYAPYLEMAKEIEAEENGELIETLNKRDVEIENKQIEEQKKAKPKKESSLKKAITYGQYLTTNRNVEIDNYAKETGNHNIQVLADHINNVQGEITTNINNNQTDNNGNTIGKGITQIFNQARKNKLSEAFNDYLFHKSNIERHKQGKGSLVPANESIELVKEYEKAYPEMKPWADEVNQYNKNLLYKQADAGLITKEFADTLNERYKFYVPFIENMEEEFAPSSTGEIKTRSTVKSARGGADKNLLKFEEAMIRQTQSAISQIRKNQLYQEIVSTKQNANVDFENNTNPDIVDSGLTSDGKKYYLTAYVDGKATQVEIDKSLYHGLAQNGNRIIRQAERKLAPVTKSLQWLSDKRRNILTTWSPTFIITNPLKDIQDAPLNSKFAKDWAKNMPKAIKEMTTGQGKNLETFLNMYGQANLRGDYNLESGVSDVTKLAKINKKANTTQKSNNKALTISKNMLKNVTRANEIVEMIPRYSEYLASLDNGCSQMEALYNAREVTTNFGRGGIITKAMNRNGFTFLNANVQGMSKLIRNFSGENGGRAVLGCIAKATALGIAPALINALFYDDDDDYEAIPDYIKDNYYLIKTSDNGFIRIPKGRMMSIFGSAARRTLESTQGRENAFEGYLSNAYNQVGVQNPIESNIFAPLIQAKNNKTWYGTDLVPKRLQTDKEGRNIPKSEQYDASTDKMSIWLGGKLNWSPYKINYVIDQYSGGVGDMVLPTITEEAQSKSNSTIGKMIAPLKDKFSADSITDNKYVTNFYSKLEELGTKPAKELTEKEEMSYQYLRNISFEIGALYKEMREVQSNTKLKDNKKYAKVQNIKAEINRLAEEGISGYKDVESYNNYARVGDRELYKYKNQKGETGWSDSNGKYADDINTLGLSIKEKNEYYTIKIKMSDTASKFKEDDGSERYRAVIKTIRNSNLPSDAKYQLYNNWYGKGDDKSSYIAQNLNIKADDYLKFKTADLTSDKNKNGYSIRGSKANKISKYLNKTKLDYGQKAVLYRMAFSYKGKYDSKYSTTYSNAYNSDIVDYINKSNLTYDESVYTLKKLGFKVKKDGTITWD